jgi:Icc-related predicted phosphoesterase
MKAFLFSDLHASYKQLDNLKKFLVGNKEIGLVIFAGDLVNMGEPAVFADNFLSVINEIKLPLLWVPGNNDFGRAYYKIQAKIKSLEGRVLEFGGNRFTGVGGSPASWSGQYAGERAVDQKDIAGSIFVSHVPPPGLLSLQKEDVSFNNFNCSLNGKMTNDKINVKCKMKNEKYFKNSPIIHICGHIHSRVGVAYLGQTKIIKLAPLETGHYAILDLESLIVDFQTF